MKAELELIQGDTLESEMDLEKVRTLLKHSPGLLDTVQGWLGSTHFKISYCTFLRVSPPKNWIFFSLSDSFQMHEPTMKTPSPHKDDGFTISNRWIHKEVAVETDLLSSPPRTRKHLPRPMLSSLGHPPHCSCPCCSEPCLGRITCRWAAVKADLMLQQDPMEPKACLKLQMTAMGRCRSISRKLVSKLAQLFSHCSLEESCLKSSITLDVMGHLYLRMAVSGLQPEASKVFIVWKVLEAGLAFVDSSSSLMLRAVKANLMAIKAMAILVAIANTKGCSPEDLLSDLWTWKLQPLAQSGGTVKPETVAKAKRVNRNPPPSTPVQRPLTRQAAKNKSYVPPAPRRPRRARFVVGLVSVIISYCHTHFAACLTDKFFYVYPDFRFQ